MNRQKRILAINDISCFGKCSLAVAVPILSAAGLETCMLPTAVLSAHTAFPDFTFRDLTEDMLPQAAHWNKLGLTFDGIYSGYLGSIHQISYVEKIMEQFSCPFVLVDPVMGDHGRLYTGFDRAYVAQMRRLLSYADVAVPNVTEAAFLADVPYEQDTHSLDYIYTMIEKLKENTKGDLVITGVKIDKETVGTAVFSAGKLSMFEREKFDVSYSGTGDVFAASFAAAMMNGFSVQDAGELASDFATECIEATRAHSGDRHYGVDFEFCMGSLLKKLKIVS